MRADRLLALLMLLQNRSKQTAHQLAEELEVTERTIYRDVDALCAAGVPIVAESGPSGGYSLLEGYRSRLTGLTDAEIEAMGALSIAGPLADLDLSQSLKSALLKLSASVPAERGQAIQHVRDRILVDAQPWACADHSPPGLTDLYHAALKDRLIQIAFVGPGGITLERPVGVLGLVAKEGTWYLISAYLGRPRVQRVDHVTIDSEDCGPFSRPEGFDLEKFWAEHQRQHLAKNQSYAVRVSVSAGLWPFLGRMLDQPVPRTGMQPSMDRPGWTDLELLFPSFEHARARLLGCGGGLVVLEPFQLAVALADVAAQVVAQYQSLDA